MNIPAKNTTGSISTVRRLFAALLMYLLCATALHAQKVSEYQVKAAFVFNFCKFIEWPADVFSAATQPFVIGIVGQDPFGTYLDEIVAGEKIVGHNMSVDRYKSVEEIGDCQILFIGSPGITAEALNKVKNKSVLTVSDEPEFNNAGGIIRFYTENEMIRLQINIAAAKEAHLEISSKLLRIAKID